MIVLYSCCIMRPQFLRPLTILVFFLTVISLIYTSLIGRLFAAFLRPSCFQRFFSVIYIIFPHYKEIQLSFSHSKYKLLLDIFSKTLFLHTCLIHVLLSILWYSSAGSHTISSFFFIYNERVQNTLTHDIEWFYISFQFPLLCSIFPVS